MIFKGMLLIARFLLFALGIIAMINMPFYPSLVISLILIILLDAALELAWRTRHD